MAGTGGGTGGGSFRRALIGAAGGVLSIAVITTTGLALGGPSAEQEQDERVAAQGMTVFELQVIAALCPPEEDTATALLDPGIDAQSWASDMETDLREFGLTKITPLSAEAAHTRLEELAGNAPQFSRVRESDLRGVVLLEPSYLANKARTLPQVSEVVDADGALLPIYTNMLNGRWQEHVNLIVFFEPDATTHEINEVSSSIASDRNIDSYYFVDQEETYAEFAEQFSDQPNVVDQVTPEDLPSSFRLVVTNPTSLTELSGAYGSMSGVRETVTAPSFPGIDFSLDTPAARDALDLVNSNCEH